MWEIWATAPDAHAQDLLNSGMARREMFDFETAESVFTALIDYCPDYAEGWNQRAFVRFLRQDFEAALPDLEEALRLNPTHVAALSGKALTLLNLGRDAEGQMILRRALDLNPWIPERAYLRAPPRDDI
jgi:tetratricopeptide (TPR) repeat protein